MPVIINTNTAASIASNNLSASNAMLQKSLNRLSSGSKIVNASDDAGGVAVAARLSAAAKRTGVVSQNIGNALSFLQHQDSALKTVGKIMERMSELQALYADNTKSDSDKTLYSTEFSALTTSLTSMSDDTVNGLSIFASSNVKVSINDSLSTTADFVNFGLANLSTVIGGTSATNCSIAVVSTLNTAIQDLAALRATNGATQSNLGFQLELQSAAKINQESAVSRIMDVDVAEESTRLARWNTLVQAGTSMIAQANGSTQSALQLLR
jgi:flagellin